MAKREQVAFHYFEHVDMTWTNEQLILKPLINNKKNYVQPICLLSVLTMIPVISCT